MTTVCMQLCENLFDIPKRSYAKIKIDISKERIDDYCTHNCGRKMRTVRSNSIYWYFK